MGLNSFFAPIVPLLQISGPTTVFRAVIAAWVNSIKSQVVRVSVFASPRGKSQIVMQPCLTNFDAQGSVIFPANRFWVCASGFHAAPNSKKTRPCFPVSCHSCSCKFRSHATTRFAFSRPKFCTRKHHFSATSATAAPSYVATFIATCAHQNYQMAKFLAGHVDDVASAWHAQIISQKRRGGWA